MTHDELDLEEFLARYLEELPAPPPPPPARPRRRRRGHQTIISLQGGYPHLSPYTRRFPHGNP